MRVRTQNEERAAPPESVTTRYINPKNLNSHNKKKHLENNKPTSPAPTTPTQPQRNISRPATPHRHHQPTATINTMSLDPQIRTLLEQIADLDPGNIPPLLRNKALELLDISETPTEPVDLTAHGTVKWARVFTAPRRPPIIAYTTNDEQPINIDGTRTPWPALDADTVDPRPTPTTPTQTSQTRTEPQPEPQPAEPDTSNLDTQTERPPAEPHDTSTEAETSDNPERGAHR